MINLSTALFCIFFATAFSLYTQQVTSLESQQNCRNYTSVLSKVLGVFDGFIACHDEEETKARNSSNATEIGFSLNNSRRNSIHIKALERGGADADWNATEVFVLADNKPILTKADTEDLIIYPSIDEFCDSTGTQPEKQRCCPVGQWLNKDGICQSIVH